MRTAQDNLERPARVVLALGDQQLVFVHVGDDRYTAKLDGTKRLIRRVQRWREVSEAGWRPRHASPQSAGETTDIDTILRCFALGAAPVPIARGVALSATEAWGRFRQNTFYKVSITVAEGGAVEIDEDIGEEDGSYY